MTHIPTQSIMPRLKKVTTAKIHGFTLLEAIVALVILASAGVALFAWLNTQMHTLQRVEQVQQRQVAQRNALALLELINPNVEPEGTEDFGLYRIHWQANLLDSEQSGFKTFGTIGLFEVGLYQIEMTVRLPDDSLLATLNARQTGYKQVIFPDEVF